QEDLPATRHRCGLYADLDRQRRQDLLAERGTSLRRRLLIPGAGQAFQPAPLLSSQKTGCAICSARKTAEWNDAYANAVFDGISVDGFSHFLRIDVDDDARPHGRE